MKLNGFVTIGSAPQGTPFVEAYGLLLASVLLGSNGKPPSVVAVTAAQSDTGVSSIAINLAMMMARTGRPTALVDANMRHPEMHKAFGLPAKPGLAEILSGKAEIKNAAAPTQIPHLSLVPSGDAGAPAQALFNQTALTELFGLLRARFDLVVIDTPPVLDYPDALHVAKCVDGVLLVVSPKDASRRDQQEARRLLDRVEARILGTVLNRVPPRERNPLARVS
ncbi:MAG: CpsD/CapB family tyrosine-protein kinase [Armatimonadota bacterium]|nr:CpsD/CapB family tyrosine-protein kinase [Armatimonadota bacterium]